MLPDRAYTRVMGALMSLVAGKVCTPVLGAKDLGEEQTYALYRIFKTLEEAVSCVNLAQVGHINSDPHLMIYIVQGRYNP